MAGEKYYKAFTRHVWLIISVHEPSFLAPTFSYQLHNYLSIFFQSAGQAWIDPGSDLYAKKFEHFGDITGITFKSHAIAFFVIKTAKYPFWGIKMKNKSLHQFINRNFFKVMCLSIILVQPAYALKLDVYEDASLDHSVLGQNLGSEQKLTIGNQSGPKDAFVRFDLSALPKTVPVHQATLSFWIDTLENNGTISVREVIGAWQENQLTAENAPQIGELVATTDVNEAQKKSYVRVDVTDLVKNWQKGLPNLGIVLQADTSTVFKLLVDSKENELTSHPMRIDIAFEGVPGLKGDQGDRGSIGREGEFGGFSSQGPDGLQGRPGSSGFQLVSVSGTIASLIENGKPITANCPRGKIAIGGICKAFSRLFTQVIASRFTGSGYTCAFGTSGFNERIATTAICIAGSLQ